MPKLYTCANREEKQCLISFISTGQYPANYSKDQKRILRRKAEHFTMLGDDLCFRSNDRLLKVVFEYENTLMMHIIKSEHEEAHIGMTKLVDLLNRKYYGIPKSVICNYVRSCQACSRFNSLQTIQPVYVNDITRKYDRYMMDCVDLRKYSESNEGYSWILNIIDTYTKYLWSIKLKNKTALSVKNALNYVFNNFGVPKSIQSDNGKEFKNALLREYLVSKNILIVHGRPRNPKSQGQVERVNQTIKRWLAKKLYNSKTIKWIEYHDEVVYSYNITSHRATSKSPFLLFHGNAGFNTIEDRGELEDTTTGLVPVNNNSNLDEPDVYNYAWDLGTMNEEDKIHGYNHPLDIILDSNYEFEGDNNITFIKEESQQEEANILRSDVLSHFAKYKFKMIENKNSNLVLCDVKIGDRVLIKKDFDNNPSTKKQSFESPFEDIEYKVWQLTSNNRVILKDDVNLEFVSVYKGSIKKIQ